MRHSTICAWQVVEGHADAPSIQERRLIFVRARLTVVLTEPFSDTQFGRQRSAVALGDQLKQAWRGMRSLERTRQHLGRGTTQVGITADGLEQFDGIAHILLLVVFCVG
jgi:hypothetical protein